MIDFDTPTERLLGTTPNYEALRIFGCACWPNLRPYNKRKLSFRSTRCVFLGYSPHHKGVKCLDTSTGRVYISRDVVFDESVFPFASLNPNAGKRLQKEILLLPLDAPSTLGDANIDDYMPLPVVPNVHPVVSDIVVPDDPAGGANTTNENADENAEELDVRGTPDIPPPGPDFPCRADIPPPVPDIPPPMLMVNVVL